MSVVGQRVSFTVPAGAGAYAPERIYLGYDPTPPVVTRGLPNATAIVAEASVAGAVVEVWVCKPEHTAGGPVDGDFILWGTATVPSEVISASAFRYRQIRVKSGGTSGNHILLVA